MLLKEAWKMINELPTNLILTKEEIIMMRRFIALLAIFCVVAVFVVMGTEPFDPVQSEADIGYGVYRLTRSRLAGAVAGGMTGAGAAFLGARIGFRIGALTGGIIGAMIGGGVGAL